MAKLTAAERKKMPKSEFAGPGKSFPLEDKTHDREAISGATRSENAGNISAEEAERIKAKAEAKLHGGKGKGKPAPKGKPDHKALADELTERVAQKDERVKASTPKRRGVMGKRADDDEGDHDYR